MAEKYTVTIHPAEVAHTSGIQVGLGQQEAHFPLVIYTANSPEKIAAAEAERELANWGVESPYYIPSGHYTTPARLVEDGTFTYRTDVQSNIKQVQKEHPELSKGVVETDHPHHALLSAQFLLALLKHKFPSRVSRKHSI